MDNIVRHDISQIDLTPLSAGLIGINFPMNSLGIIPIDILDVSNKIKSKLLFGNMMELYEIYKITTDKTLRKIDHQLSSVILTTSC